MINLTNLEAYIFDQDGTLYSRRTNLAVELSARTKAWMLGNAKPSIFSFDDFKRQFPNFPEALDHCGLRLSQWHAMVCDPISHEMDLLIDKDPDLIKFLSSLPGYKYLVTLSSARLTEKLLSALGIRGQFSEVFNLNVGDKGATYQKIQQGLGLPPQKIGVFGDSKEVDLKPADQLGLKTFYVNPSSSIVDQYNADSI